LEELPRFRVKFSWRTIAVAVIIVVVIVAVMLPSAILRTVDVGYGTLIIDPLSGTVSQPTIGPAWFFKAPWAYTKNIYYATDSIGMWKEDGLIGDFPPITPISADGLRIEVDILVRWSLDPTKLKVLYQRYPNLNWKDTVISSVIRETGRNVMGQYTAIEVIENRSIITQNLSDSIVASLLTEESLFNAVLNAEVDLRDIDPPIAFLQAIEAKLAAEQAQLQAEFEKEKILILANASATENIIAAEGEAAARLIVANGTAESIRIIAQDAGMNSTELTNLFLTLEALKEIAKTTQTFVVVMGQDGLTYLLPVE